ncbi:hypothetical protein E4U42_006189 [Claviceps africana]|uniref:Uncharacterized protein n=1 Tax=Claviceps africana TaxID=83212 RepID=A0A8K0NLC1_9HYPO|nr:hypothetical protein E4U42_006189 [Claviceps africana]
MSSFPAELSSSTPPPPPPKGGPHDEGSIGPGIPSTASPPPFPRPISGDGHPPGESLSAGTTTPLAAAEGAGAGAGAGESVADPGEAWLPEFVREKGNASEASESQSP